MRIMIAAGGTGGHIFPAIALTNALLNANHEVLFITSNNAIAHEILDPYSFDKRFYDLQGLSRKKNFKGLRHNMIAAYKLNVVNRKLKKEFDKFQPEICIGFGSYVSYPAIQIANKRNITTIIHEQNSYPGLVNRMVCKNVDYVCYTYKHSLNYFPDYKSNPQKYVYTSNPRIDGIKPHPDGDFILFLGGSQGAKQMNELAIEMSKITSEMVVLISGTRFPITYTAKNFVSKKFVPDLLNLMRQARYIITRGGATTLIECSALHKKTIAIPSPNVVANHQYFNAKELADQGYVQILEEQDATVENLAKLIDNDFVYKPFPEINSNQRILDLIEEINARN